jgi:hypothetical protein
MIPFFHDLHHADRVQVVFKQFCGSRWWFLVADRVSLRMGLAVEARCYLVGWFILISQNALFGCCRVLLALSFRDSLIIFIDLLKSAGLLVLS